MSRFAKLILTGFLAVAAMGAIAPVASAQRVFIRGGFYGPGFYYGPAWYGGWYGPGYYGGPYGYYGYGYRPSQPTGSIKFETKMKDASVYVDGGYAGTVEQLKTFKLHAGTHDVELRSPDGHTFYQQKLDVVAGKTLKITP
jgi:hypothetical protein